MGGIYPCFKVLSIALLLLAFAICADTALCDEIPYRSPSWSTPDEVIDLAVSADGSIIAVATAVTELGTITEGWLKVYSASGNLLWWWGGENIVVTAVDVSDDGNVVAAAIENKTQLDGYPLLFWKNAKTLSGTPQPNWSSCDLEGWIGAEALAVSSDGNQVVVVGTGFNVYYWNNTLALSGSNINPTWGMLLPNYLECVDISDDGDVVAILGYTGTGGIPTYYVFVYKNCRSRTGASNPPDLEHPCGGSNFRGSIALSDDGMYLVVGIAYRILFFNTTVSVPWGPQWTCLLKSQKWVAAVDISSEGNTVVAAINSYITSPLSLSIFQGASSKTGTVTDADKNFTGASTYTDYDYTDVSVDGLGNIAVAGTGDYVFAVNASTGEPLWYYDGTYPLVSRFVKVSEDGSAVVTAGGEIDSLYYFRLVAAPPAVGGLISPRIPTIVSITTLTVLLIAVVGMLIITVKGKLHR